MPVFRKGKDARIRVTRVKWTPGLFYKPWGSWKLSRVESGKP